MSTSSNCAEVQGEIPLYVGGDLESPALERLEQHLGLCPACRETLSRANEARDALRDHLGNPQIEASCPSHWPGIRSALVAEGILVEEGGTAPTGATGPRGIEPTAARPVRRGRLLRILPLAAAAAALFVLGMLTDRLGSVSPGEASGVHPGGGGPIDEVVIDDGPATGDPIAERIETPRPGVSLKPVPSGDDSLRSEALIWGGEVILDPRLQRGSRDGAAGLHGEAQPRRDGLH